MTITKQDSNQLIKDMKKVFVTKGELRKVVREEIDEALDEKLDQKFFDFKSELFTKIDPILKEVVASREERVITASQLSNHDDRITKLEQVVIQ